MTCDRLSRRTWHQRTVGVRRMCLEEALDETSSLSAYALPPARRPDFLRVSGERHPLNPSIASFFSEAGWTTATRKPSYVAHAHGLYQIHQGVSWKVSPFSVKRHQTIV